MTCLQRLVIGKGLPKSKLKNALDAFNACADLGLEIQLKVLQALPALLQNYANELEGELLAGALQVCCFLQSAKAPTVSGVAAATLQQLVTAIFEKVSDEDRTASQIPAHHEVPGDGEPIVLRPAAFDAYRVFRDLALAAEGRPTKFVQLNSLSPESSLELVHSCISSNGRLFALHPELLSTIGSNLLPLVTNALSEKLGFPMTVRCMRILDLTLNRYFHRFSEELEVALGLLNHSLDADAATPWKRAISAEVVRHFFTNGGLVIEAYARFDQGEGGKPVVQDLLATFVRLSAEKPAVIGLGQQSSVPIGPSSKAESSDPATLEAAGGVAGVISSALGVTETNVAGISSQWSLPRTACLDQLDKVDGPPVPETYVYTIVLECLNSLSDSLARVILPLTVQQDQPDNRQTDDGQANGRLTDGSGTRLPRSKSFRMRSIPVNPLDVEDGSIDPRVRAVGGLVGSCWPAWLATSSTFLNAALEEQYYRNLIKAYQRFTQVAGLLRLSTPRDALLTTLSKSAVPLHVLSAANSDGARSPVAESPRVFSNPKNLLSVDSLVSQATSLSIDRDRRQSAEPPRPMLTTRNLLCLRALLNLAIALGPTLGTSFSVVVDTLRQADLILSSGPAQSFVRQSMTGKGQDTAAAVQAFSAEVAAVESAASRLIESTADYPNDAFMNVLKAFSRLLGAKSLEPPLSPRLSQVSPPSTPTSKHRTFSGLPGISTLAEMQARDYQFVVPKLGALAELNIPRFVSDEPSSSGWDHLVNELAQVATGSACPREARRAAGNILCKSAASTILAVLAEDDDIKASIQRRGLAVLLQIVDGIYSKDSELTSTDLDIQVLVFEALKAVLERCGDSLIAGWNKTLAIIGSTFERTEEASATDPGNADISIEWQHVTEDFVSVPVGRVAFSAMQLVCSDFLAVIPNSEIPSLLELLRRFIGQSEDLNVALTSVTIAWNVSNQMLGAELDTELDVMASALLEVDDKEERIRREAGTSKAAQLMLLLLHICQAVCETQREVRNAAFQTLCSIFKSHGSRFHQATWDLMLRSIIFPVAAEDVITYQPSKNGSRKETLNVRRSDVDSSRAIISGVSDLVAQHIRDIERLQGLPRLWEVFLSTMEAYLDCERHALNTAVYQAVSSVLSRVDAESKQWTTPLYRTIAFWLKRLPGQADDMRTSDSNQRAYSAYLEAASELYRLTKDSMSPPQTRKLIDNICECIRTSDGPGPRADVNNLSPVQAKALDLLKQMRTNLSSLPSRLITAAAELSLLYCDAADHSETKQGPTFVAISSEAIDWFRALIEAHLGVPEIYETDTLSSALKSFRRMIAAKYRFQTEHKGVALWRRATFTALAICPAVLRLTDDCEQSTGNAIWGEFASIAAGIVAAGGLDRVGDRVKIEEDESFDVENFRNLRSQLVPGLGRAELNDGVRQIYCQAIFEASIVHQPEPEEILESSHSPLEELGKIRRGRVKHVPYSQRERMSYVCFEELIALSSQSDDSEEAMKLAQAAAPLLILRLAIPIRAYIADQPLRGRRPQPLSELEELLFCFEQIKRLGLHPQALAHDPVAEGRTGSSAHLQFLYPLLAQAVATAGDRWSGSEEVLTPLQPVLASITPIHT